VESRGAERLIRRLTQTPLRRSVSSTTLGVEHWTFSDFTPSVSSRLPR
jgi:hypothetical protein